MKEIKLGLKSEMKGSLAVESLVQVPLLTRRALMNPGEVSELTGLSRETLAQWRSQKRGIPYLKIGRAVRYDPAEVQAYLEGCRVSVSDPRERRRK